MAAQMRTDQAGSMTIVLFDIDLTLVDTDGAGREALELAFEELYGVAGAFEGVPFHGRTDLDIIADALQRASVGVDEERSDVPQEFIDKYIANLESVLSDGRGRVLGGVESLLGRLGGRGDVALGLATGNFRRAARIKLARYGLWDCFLDGGFGDDSADRSVVVSIGARRVAQVFEGSGSNHAAPSRADRVVVVGDSVLDVAAAHANDFGAVAVATGLTPPEALVDAGAEVVLEDLCDTEAVISAVLSATRRPVVGRGSSTVGRVS